MITLQIASLKQREKALKVCLESLYDQVDHIRLMLNGYDEVPIWIRELSKVEAHLRDNKLMDGERFYLNETNEGHILFCDDDLKYPSDFVSILTHYYCAHGGIVSIMGANLLPRPIWSYNTERHEHFRVMNYVSKPNEVDIIGMCGALTHSDYFKMTTHDVHVMNSDINTSVYCKKNGIKKIVIPHRPDWVEDLMKTLPPDAFTIWNYNKPLDNDQIITDFINKNI